jgi:hypothetical protein
MGEHAPSRARLFGSGGVDNLVWANNATMATDATARLISGASMYSSPAVTSRMASLSAGTTDTESLGPEVAHEVCGVIVVERAAAPSTHAWQPARDRRPTHAHRPNEDVSTRSVAIYMRRSVRPVDTRRRFGRGHRGVQSVLFAGRSFRALHA